MKLKINLARKDHRERPVKYLAYLPLLLFLLATLGGSYYWYSSINADIARYKGRLKEVEEMSLKAKRNVAEESISLEEKELLQKEALFINNIIKGRSFSWSGLLTQLEKDTIPNISLVSLTPKVDKDKVRIDIRGVGKDLETITRFMDRLERSPSFQDLFLLHSTDAELDGERLVNFSMELEYTGR